jgi:hypothetical protein
VSTLQVALQLPREEVPPRLLPEPSSRCSLGSQLTAEQRRSLIEQLRRYESFTCTLDFVGKGTLKSRDEALR